MQKTMDDTKRRREKQLAYNEEFGCTAQSTKGSTMMSIFDLLREEIKDEQGLEIVGRSDGSMNSKKVIHDLERIEIPLPSSAERICGYGSALTLQTWCLLLEGWSWKYLVHRQS
jgi:excinuclease UvrABC helicase subunit UvrB